MTQDKRDPNLDNLARVIAVEGTRLEELAVQFSGDGQTELAEHVSRAARMLEEAVLDLVERVKSVAPVLRDVDMALERKKMVKLALSVRNLRRRLTLAADAAVDGRLPRLTTGEYPVNDDGED